MRRWSSPQQDSGVLETPQGQHSSMEKSLLWSQTAWVQLQGYYSEDRGQVSPSVPQFPYLENGDNHICCED